MIGIWLPIELLDLDISWTKRILIAEISQLEMLDKGCIASNAHFSQKLRISKQAVSKALNELCDDGYIIIDNAQTKRNFGREITINFSKSGINFGVSGIHESGESKGRIHINNILGNSVAKQKEFTPPILTDIQAYIKEHSLNVDATKFLQYYTVSNWLDNKGKQVKNWKLKLISWNSSYAPKNKRLEDMTLEEKMEYNEAERQRKIEANYG